MMFALALLLLAAVGGAKKKSGGGDNRKLPPAPTPDTVPKRNFLCGLIREGFVRSMLLPLWLRERYPAVSWPAADEWSVNDVANLPAEDRKTYDAARVELDTLLRDASFIAQCTRIESPYASGQVSPSGEEYTAKWSYDPRVSTAGALLRYPSFDAARTALLEAVWWFGAPMSDQDSFVEGWQKPGTRSRLSVWRMPGGGYRVVKLRDGMDPTSTQVATIELARAQRGTL